MVGKSFSMFERMLRYDVESDCGAKEGQAYASIGITLIGCTK